MPNVGGITTLKEHLLSLVLVFWLIVFQIIFIYQHENFSEFCYPCSVVVSDVSIFAFFFFFFYIFALFYIVEAPTCELFKILFYFKLCMNAKRSWSFLHFFYLHIFIGFNVRCLYFVFFLLCQV